MDLHLFFLCFRLLAAKYRPYGVYKDARSIVVIHNLAHQVDIICSVAYVLYDGISGTIV